MGNAQFGTTHAEAANATRSGNLPAEIWQWDASQIAARIASGEISSREAVTSCLARIDETNGRINAIVHLDADKALRMADQADAQRQRGEPLGLLHGVPLTVKVNVDVIGEATTHGVVNKKNLIAQENSAVVSNLLAAGAVIVGRTNTPAFSLRWFTENALHGRTLNPWNDDITPGGSSGGASAAVAAGMCPLAHGNDLAGSVRYPAYACGIAGLRPTAGRIPTFTPSSGDTRSFAAQYFAVQGPIARRVRDLRLGLAAMAAGDSRDPAWVPAPLEGPSQHEPKMVALIDEIEGVPIVPEVRHALQQAAAWLEQEGYRVERATPPSMMEGFNVWMAIAMTEIRTELAATIDSYADEQARRAVRDMLRHHDFGTDLKSYIHGFARRDAAQRKWNAFFDRYPVVLMPTSCELPFTWGTDQQGEEAMGRLMRAQLPLKLVAALNFAGLSVPTGVIGRVPVGVQLVSRAFREDLCLAAGEAIERHAAVPAAYDC